MSVTGGTAAAEVPVTRELAVRLLDKVPELGRRLHESLVAKDPIYATTDLVSTTELARSCHDNIARAIEALAGRLPEGADLLDATRRTATNRADDGFPLESLLHAYRLGTEVLWGALLDEARSNAPHLLSGLLDSAMVVMELTDRMALEAASVYRAREAQARQRDSERRQAALESLLEGRGNDPDVAAETARVLQLPTDARLAVVVVRFDRPSTSPQYSPEGALDAHGFRSIWRLRADREIGLVQLGEAPLDRLVERLRTVITGHQAGVSSVFIGPADTAAALRTAELALETVAPGGTMVAAVDDRLPEALLAASPTLAERIRERTLGPVIELDDAKRDLLLETLDCWLRHGRSAADAGEHLHCHRNTVLHRLDRIEKLTGLSLSNTRDELLVRLALLAR